MVQSVAHLLAAAVERQSNETSQAALASFGRFALASRDAHATRDRALELATTTLEVPFAVLARPVGPQRLRVACSRGPSTLTQGQEIEISPKLMRAWASGEPLRVQDWCGEQRFPQPAATFASPIRSALMLAVRADGQAWGLTVGDVRPRPWQQAEVDSLQTLANTLASTMERERIESRLRRTTRQLQHVLLPTALPTLPDVQIAARYLPPAAGLDVGGDWYDVLDLPHDGVGLVIGDVEGHDSTAAAIAGQIRTVLRTYVAEGHPPAEIMRQANAFTASITDRLVTCCYSELNLPSGTLTSVNAGHPPPLLVTPDVGIRSSGYPLHPAAARTPPGRPR